MQDIDFDELDRAVNSVTSPTVSDASAQESVPVTVTPAAPVAPIAPVSTPAARRSGGRFMDVVHPSSDMRSASQPNTDRVAPRSESSPFVAAPVAVEKPATEWPDPLDFHGFTEEPAVEAPVINTPSVEAPAAPLESPFLNDAKVEKRPLGAFSYHGPSGPSTPRGERALIEAPEPELLLEAVNDEPVEETVVSEPEASAPVIETPAPTPIEEAPTGPISITQQYKEQPSTADQPSGAIFDTEAYHQPLTHGPKRKSGALVVVWIAALILVGAGAGAAVYFFILPTL